MLTQNPLKTSHVHTKQKGHISLMREKFRSNRVTILQGLGLTDDEYNNLFFESGCLFLEQLYNRDDKHLSFWYEKLAKDPSFMFWRWFKVEFRILENDWLNILAGGNYPMTQHRFNEFISSIPHDIYLEKSLIQFLKQLKYVEL